MRLSTQEQQVLRRAVTECFGDSAQVRLFGSRVDDAGRGGDIDLLIETPLTDPQRIAAAHTRFLSAVYARMGEQKVDVLIDFPTRQTRSPIYQVARTQGVLL